MEIEKLRLQFRGHEHELQQNRTFAILLLKPGGIRAGFVAAANFQTEVIES